MPDDRTDRGGNYWTLFTPGIWKDLHAVSHPKAFRSRIFERFAQANGSAGRQKGGSDLGLWITRAIIERHGGTIGFTDGPDGVGTVFHIDLPLLNLSDSALPPVALPEFCAASVLTGTDDAKVVP